MTTIPTDFTRDNAERLHAIRRLCPWFDAGVGRTCLYVGAMPTRADFVDVLAGAGWAIDILEVWEPYLDRLRTLAGVRAVYLGDVRTWQPVARYDLAMWWHGPEHVPAGDIGAALATLERCASAVLLGCPWGETGSGDTGGNDHNRHVSQWTGAEFAARGYAVAITSAYTVNVTAAKGSP